MGIEELTELYSRTLKDNAEDMTRIMHVISKIGLVLVAKADGRVGDREFNGNYWNCSIDRLTTDRPLTSFAE